MSAEENREELNRPKSEDSKPGSKPKAVFSDDFDDPERKAPVEELPDDEPLTPELVEEEAIRGDFMLRWATIFLAILMAFTQISDTKPLVLVRSGEYMRSHGFLPPRTDQFSLTAEGKPYANVSWLFDHLVSLAWSAGGATGLTVLKVILGGLAAWLLTRISIPGVPTWWNSICTGLAVVACSQDFTPTSEIISVLGMTLVMQFLIHHRLEISSNLHWKLPLLFAVWCNLDSKAWVGVFVVCLYAIGNAISRRGLIRQEVPSGRIPSPMGMTSVLCLIALLVNPFPVASLLSPVTTYSIEYPAMQSQKSLQSSLAAVANDNRLDFYSILTPDAVVLFDHTHVAGIAVFAIGLCILMTSLSSESTRSSGTISRIVGILLLPQRLVSGQPVREAALLFSLGGMILLVVLKLHELPVASIVAAVTAGVVAQEWYRRSFSMKYSAESREVLFSRGGRALTVLAFAAIGFCVVTSRLPGASPLGRGFDLDTQVTIDTISRQLEELDPSANVLHTRLEHGDLLIWNGRKSFVDSRVLPFGRPGDPQSVFGQHSNFLQVMAKPAAPPEDMSDPQVKKRYEEEQKANKAAAESTLAGFKVSHVMVRLAPPGRPDYSSLMNLTSTGRFLPTMIGASSAILEKIPENASLQEFVNKSPNFIEMAFRSQEEAVPRNRGFATVPTFMERHIYRTRPHLSESARLASHYLYLGSSQPKSRDQAMNSTALLILSIRNLNAALQQDPDNADLLVNLGVAYVRLGVMEGLMNGQESSGKLTQLRLLQSVSAFSQAVKIDPNRLEGWDGLVAAYQRMGRRDLLLQALEGWLSAADLPQNLPLELRAAFEEERTRRYASRRDLEDQLAELDVELDKRVESVLANKPPIDQAVLPEGSAMDKVTIDEARDAMLTAMVLNLGGRPVRALQALREDAAAVQMLPEGSLLMGQLLLESGNVEEAFQILMPFSQEATGASASIENLDWEFPAVASQLAICDYENAATTLAAKLRSVERQVDSASAFFTPLLTMPLVADVNVEVNGQLPVWPVRNCMAIQELISSTGSARAENAMLLAMVQIEDGKLSEAKSTLQRVISHSGDTQDMGLIRAYYSMLDKDANVFLKDYSYEPWSPFEFPGEPEPPAQPVGASPLKPQP